MLIIAVKSLFPGQVTHSQFWEISKSASLGGLCTMALLNLPTALRIKVKHFHQNPCGLPLLADSARDDLLLSSESPKPDPVAGTARWPLGAEGHLQRQPVGSRDPQSYSKEATSTNNLSEFGSRFFPSKACK